MNIEDLKKDLEKGDAIYRGLCHDCGKHVTVKAELAEDETITIAGGAIYKVAKGIFNVYYFKCDSCFKKDHTLRNWRDTEVYSRVVGYLRPVNQWNKGKVAEWNMRKEFINSEESEEMKRKVTSKRIYKAGYEVRTEEVSMGERGKHIIMKSAYTANGDYIGDSRWAYRLCKIRGITPEKRTPDSNVCSIGFCEREKKWYSWSHRAIFGFGIGAKTKRGDCGYVPSDINELTKEYSEWNEHVEIKNAATIEICAEMSDVTGVNPDGSLILERSDKHDCYNLKTGRGEWIAETIEDAKQMAMDFAEGVS